MPSELDHPLTPESLEELALGETTLRQVDRSRERDEVQSYFDNLVTEAYDKWVTAGRPTVRRERPALRVDCPSEDTARAVFNRLRASAVHLNVGISLDQPSRLAEDKWRVAFSAQDKRRRAAKKSA
jgi:hypothetical protein